MHQIGFAGSALLALVLAGREKVGAPQQIEVSLRMVASDFLADFFDANHKSWCFDLCALYFGRVHPSVLTKADESVCKALSTKHEAQPIIAIGDARPESRRHLCDAVSVFTLVP